MGAAESVPETSIHEFTVKVPPRISLRGMNPRVIFRLLSPNLFILGENFHFWEQDCNGKEVCLEAYKGKVLLVVNVASKWLVPVSSPSQFHTNPLLLVGVGV
jgi:glutathione peroxidase